MFTGNSSQQERLEQLKAFDESKAGVKGIVDSGITKLPPIFIRPNKDPTLVGDQRVSSEFIIPVVDLAEYDGRRGDVIDQIRRAAESYGFFQVVNHGVPDRVMEEIMEATRAFHELPREVKAEYYGREMVRKVKYFTSSNMYELMYADWRDSMQFNMSLEDFDPQDIPPVLRDIIMEYSKHGQKLGVTLFELLSEALGLKPDHLINLDCAKGHMILNHYYPPCPEPELTMGTNEHSDANFLTILLQDQIGGLQVLLQNQWINVTPVPGALIINIGDLLQLISNGKFISVKHRVVAKQEGPRISVAFFFVHLSHETTPTVYEPIKELTSEANPPIYKPKSLSFSNWSYLPVPNFMELATGKSRDPEPDRMQQLKAFDESKAGVKGIVDAGITALPPMFVCPKKDPSVVSDLTVSGHFNIPLVDLTEYNGMRAEVIDQVRGAAESYGFFQVVNHGMPEKVMKEILEAARVFHELPREEKAEYYTREMGMKVRYFSGSTMYQYMFVDWKDTLLCDLSDEQFDPRKIPLVCRDITMKYSKHVQTLGVKLFELLSEALGLKPDHLINLDTAKGHMILSHYYPPCPEPELAIGTVQHSDPDFITILLQDQIGGLQVLHQDQWIDVPYIPGALVVNIGDFLQLISNNKFLSVKHRVLAKKEGPRISIACFFRPSLESCSRLYGPIKELTSEEKPAVYQETTLKDYVMCHHKRSGLDDLKL